MVKKIAILGSTGSIGTNAVKVVQHLGGEIQIRALAARSNIDLLESQARLFAPALIGVYDEQKARELQKRLPHIPVLAGMEGLQAVAAYDDVDMVLSAMSGTMGILPTIAAIQKGKQIALANKEVLVSAGDYVTTLAKQTGSVLIPVDSEHTALFQCLQGPPNPVQRLILTASGGPFYHSSLEELSRITVDQALCHPNYRMGTKNTIDSSTLMNKGLEVIEAHWLFQVPIDQIEVTIHPQQVIHSMVEFIDGSILAQLSAPTMLIPIQYALTYPERRPGMLPPFDFTKHSSLDFSPPDMQKFSCLRLAYEALRQGGSTPCYLNAANEILVSRFMNREIGWLDIAHKLEKLLSLHAYEKQLDLEKIIHVDALARCDAQHI